MRAKRWAQRLVSFVRFDHLRNAPNRRIRRQSEALPQLGVRELLQHDLVGALLRKGDARQPGCGLVEPLNGCAQRLRLGDIGQELELQGQFHANGYIGIMSQCQLRLPGGIEAVRLNLSFPCQLKQTAPRKGLLWTGSWKA